MNAPVQSFRQFGLTPRMRDCLNAIKAHVAAEGCAPSFRELATRLDLASTGRIHHLLSALQERGRITFQPTRQRSIVVLPVPGELGYALPAAVETSLRAYCAIHKEDPSAIVADAVMLFLDERAHDVETTQEDSDATATI